MENLLHKKLEISSSLRLNSFVLTVEHKKMVPVSTNYWNTDTTFY